MKKTLKNILNVIAFMVAFIMLTEAFPIQAIDSIVDEIEETVEETTTYPDETKIPESSGEETTEGAAISDAEETTETIESESEEETTVEAETSDESVYDEPETDEPDEKGEDEDETDEEALDLSDRPEEPEASVLGEVTGERRYDGKVFRMSDGTYTSVGYPLAVHYENEAGELVQIDNSPTDIKEDGEDAIDAVKDNVFDLSFFKNAKEGRLYVLKFGDENIDISIEGSKESEIKSVRTDEEPGQFDVPNIAGTYEYKDILKNTDIKYTVLSTNIKENVILKEKVDFNSITYFYRTNENIRLTQKDEHTIELKRTDSDEVLAELSAPLAWDAAGEFCRDLSVSVEKGEDNEYRVTLSWDEKWANDPDRVYPITIDPIISTQISYSGATSDIDDAFAREVSYNEPANWEILRVGRTDATGRTRSVIKIHLEDYVPKNANIVNATINLIPFIFDWGGYTTPFVNDFANEPIINLYRMTSDWSESTFCWNTLWSSNASNGYDSQIVSYVKIGNYDPSTFPSTPIPIYSWDITQLANDWINGTYSNYGVMLAYNNESATGSMFFASSDWIYAEQYAGCSARPRALFQYIDTTGIEDYYSAHALSAGRAGTAYINDMTGNLTVVNNILSLGNGQAPINLALVYNSNNSSETYARPLGKGWKFNYCQSIQLTSLNVNSRRYFKYIDGDGTEHYYLEDSAGGYSSTDEVDSKNKLTYNSSNYEFKLSAENSGTKAFFKKSGSVWYLDRIEDDYGNKVAVTYSSSSHDMITKLESTDGYTVNLSYNSNNFLTSVTYRDITTKTISFGYSNSAVTSITYEDGKTANYAYVSGTHRLKSLSDIDGYKCEFTYTGGTGIKPLRVNGVTEKGMNGTVGQQMSMSYGLRSMTLTDITNSRTYLYSFSSLGTIKSIVDTTSNDKNAYAEYYEYNNKSADQLNKGNLTFASQTQKSTINLLKNHSFESSSGQTFTVWGTNNSPMASASYSTAKAHLGTHSVKLNRPSGNNSSRVLSYALVNLTAGNEYTFSAYVNTSEMTSVTKGATLFIYYASGGNTYSFESEAVTETMGSNEWKRISVAFTPTYSGNVSICLSLSGATGSVYFDNIQLEEDGLSEYNLLENAGFDYSALGWAYDYAESTYSSTGGFPGGCGKIAGGPAVRPHISQTLNYSGNKGDVYVATAMAQASYAPTFHGNYAMLVRFYNNGTTVNTAWIYFNSATNAWHKAAGQAIADGNYTKINVFLLYYNGTNSAYFDNVTLTKDYFGNTYTYDDKGNIKSTKDLASNEENTFTYNGSSHLIKQTNISGSKIEYTYDSTKKHQLNSVLAAGITTSFAYDGYGNAIISTSKNSDNTKNVYSGATYNDRGGMMATTDSLGNTTSYKYKERLVDEVTDASGAKVNYEYNTSRLPTQSTFTKGSTSAEVSYGYDSNNYLTSLTSPGGTVYGFTYDSFGRKLTTSVGQTALSTNTYNNKGLLTGAAYGNGFTQSFAYDYLNRLKSESVGNNVRVSYNYDGKGRISEKKDYLAGVTTKNEYDLLDRIAVVNTIDNSTNNIIQSARVNYDNKNRVSGIDYSYLGTTKSTEYVYGTGTQEPSVVYGVKLGGTQNLTYTYDDLFRKTGKTLNGANNFATTYSYSAGKKICDMQLYSSAYDGKCAEGDINGDGYADLALMYRCSSSHCKIYVWLADGNGGYNEPINMYEDTNYEASKVTGRMTAGDFDGDGCDEIAAFYDMGSNNIALHIFKYSNGTLTKTVPYSATGSGDFWASRITNRVTAGDYNGDGCDEIAVMYDYGSSLAKILVFRYTDTAYSIMAYSSWYNSGSGNFDANAVTGRFVSGDFDGDGCDEIAAMYDTGSDSMVVYVFNRNGNATTFTLETWITAGAGVFGAGYVTGTLVAGNFVGDSKDDLAMVYKYPSCARILTYESLGNQFGHWAQRHNGNDNYTFENMQYRVFGGNVDGTGYDEIVAMYRQTSASSSIYVFENTGESEFELNSSVWNSQLVVTDNAGAMSTRVSSETIGGDTYTYTYDILGNVTEIKKNGQAYRSYKYDDLGELIREDNVEANSSYAYTYDGGGNITRKRLCSYTSPESALPSNGRTYRYEYSTGEWKDQLTRYNYYDIEYDEIGNPIDYIDYEMTWTDGRRLAGVTSYGETLGTYTYDASGIRRGKSVDGVTHEYYLDGTKIICEKRSDGITLDFYYDDSGNILAMGYSGSMYYYVRNILGEIIGIVDTSGNYVVKYVYNAWGYPEEITNGTGVDVSYDDAHIANINPFRYKGYYYDTETGFYYLQSRYYDPVTGRFVNSDALIQSSSSFLGMNLFAYCNNCPTMLKDSSGSRPILCGPDEEETDEQRKESYELMRIQTARTNRMKKDKPEIIGNAMSDQSFKSLLYYGGTADLNYTEDLGYGVKKTIKYVSYIPEPSVEDFYLEMLDNMSGFNTLGFISTGAGVTNYLLSKIGHGIPYLGGVLTACSIIFGINDLAEWADKEQFKQAMNQGQGVLIIEYSIGGSRVVGGTYTFYYSY